MSSHRNRSPSGCGTHRRLSALSMVQVAKQCGLIGDIGGWVLELGFRDRGRLREHPDVPLGMAVNASGQLMSPGLLHRRRARAGRAQGLGIRITLDDFRTGFSSLSYLRWWPIDIVKIDQGFTGDIDRAPAGCGHRGHGDRPVARARVGRRRRGSRDPEPAGPGRRYRCEYAQGYFRARPMSAAALASRLDRRGAGPLRLTGPAPGRGRRLRSPEPPPHRRHAGGATERHVRARWVTADRRRWGRCPGGDR